jgi:hypothetical protein
VDAATYNPGFEHPFYRDGRCALPAAGHHLIGLKTSRVLLFTLLYVDCKINF